MDPDPFWVFFFLAISCVFSTVIGRSKGRGFQGFCLGCLLGPIGLILITILPDTTARADEKRSALAEAIAAGVNAHVGSAGLATSEEERREAMAKAIATDPSLGSSSDPATLERLRRTVDQILLDQETIRSRAALERQRAEEEGRRARQEEARLASLQQAERRAEEEQKKKAAEAVRLASMKPLARFIRVHRHLIGIGSASLLVIAAVTLGFWRNTVTSERRAASQEKLAASKGQAWLDGISLSKIGGYAKNPTVPPPIGEAPIRLKIKDLVTGKGEEVTDVTTPYSWNYEGVSWSNGKVFDSSFDRGAPIPFALNQVIPGWTEGLIGIRVGGRRMLVIPPEMAYGESGSPPAIGPNEPLVFVVDLVGPAS